MKNFINIHRQAAQRPAVDQHDRPVVHAFYVSNENESF